MHTAIEFKAEKAELIEKRISVFSAETEPSDEYKGYVREIYIKEETIFNALLDEALDELQINHDVFLESQKHYVDEGSELLSSAIRDGKLTQGTLNANAELKLSLQHSIGPIQPQASVEEKQSYKDVVSAFKSKLKQLQNKKETVEKQEPKEEVNDSRSKYESVIDQLVEQSIAYDRHFLETGERQAELETQLIYHNLRGTENN